MRNYTYEIGGLNRDFFLFDSQADLTSFVNKDFMLKDGKTDFIGREFGSAEDVEEALNQLWKEGVDVLEEYVTRLSTVEIPEIKSRKRKTSYSFTEGDDFDFEKFMQGDAYWKESKREETGGAPTMTIVIDTTTPWFQDSFDILWRGAAAIALTKTVEEKGYGVDLWVVNGSKLYSWESTKVMTGCQLKKSSEPLDASTMVNVVSGWFYRTETFALLRTCCQHKSKQVEHGFGSCMTPDQDDLDRLNDDANRVYASGVFSMSGAEQLMVAELKKLEEMNKEK